MSYMSSRNEKPVLHGGIGVLGGRRVQRLPMGVRAVRACPAGPGRAHRVANEDEVGKGRGHPFGRCIFKIGIPHEHRRK